MTKYIKPDWREQRRFQALNLKEKGWKNVTIAEALGVSQGAVSHWFKKVSQRQGEQGREVLKHQPSPGRPAKLSKEQLEKLPQLLLKGPTSFGFTGQLWTSSRVAWVIKTEFGVRMHRTNVSRLLREIGWSVQKPIERASQRDEAAIEDWRLNRWPQLKKKRLRKAEKSSL